MNMQRLQALIGLIAQRPVSQQNCLSDEQLIDFINGELKGYALRQVQQHLNACPDCYREWQQMCDVMIDAPQVAIKQKSYWFEAWQEWLTFKSVFATASALASIIAIVLFLPISSQNSLEQQINYAFQQLQVHQQPANSNIYDEVMMSDMPTGFSFSPTQPSTQQLAFQQGINVAQGLPKKSAISDTEKQYYELGRWIILLQQTSELETELSVQFWQQQQSILEQFRQDFTNNNQVSPHLDKLGVVLRQLPTSEKLDLYDKLYRYTDFIQQDLGQ